MSDFQQCGVQHVVSGVTVTCHRISRHAGPHSSSTYGTRWRDSGEVLPPPRCSERPARDLRCRRMLAMAETRRAARRAGSAAMTGKDLLPTLANLKVTTRVCARAT